MSDIAIRAEGLSKRYRVGLAPRRQDNLQERLADGLRNLLQRRSRKAAGADTLWALKDVSFEVRHGEVVGIIGRNGAGKSTLLKILSRITKPTTGCAEVHGRMGSLLEVGTGFHPELTGRENIYLNGVILGMKRAEVARRFDEIVAFAEIEKFLDTPVKRYSSGMYVRLAFAVAAHLNTKILIVDEVLAVGDAAFQRKCLAKMEEAAYGGRTVLFVSHNLAVVQKLCSRGILLSQGRVGLDGSASAAVRAYLRSLESFSTLDVSQRPDREGHGQTRLRALRISHGKDPSSATLATGQPARFVFELERMLPGLSCCFTIWDHHGQPVAYLDSARHAPADVSDPGLGSQFVCEIEELPLLPGRYRINVAVATGPDWSSDLQDRIEGAAVFEVEQGLMRGRPETADTAWGNVCIAHRWLHPPTQN
ncbi:MAG: ABC transporter ATP-binding protein, partial [Isosphaeraceae bacterium]|nr:ABC transporter ATP-binding protein [Isosphaeraceae bacterium]